MGNSQSVTATTGHLFCPEPMSQYYACAKSGDETRCRAQKEAFEACMRLNVFSQLYGSCEKSAAALDACRRGSGQCDAEEQAFESCLSKNVSKRAEALDELAETANAEAKAKKTPEAQQYAAKMAALSQAAVLVQISHPMRDCFRVDPPSDK